MTECFRENAINEYVSRFDFDVNEIIGFYLSQNDHDNFKSGANPKMDGYLKIFSPKRLKNLEISNSNLNEMSDLMSSNFLNSRWDDITKKVDELGTKLKIDVPIKLEEYNLSDNSRTIITFMKTSSEIDEVFTIMVINLLNIKNRLIWASYYQSYSGHETVSFVKKKNDYLINKLLTSNSEN